MTQTPTTLTPTTFTPVTCVVPPCGWACKCVRGSGPGRSSPLDSRAAPPIVMVNPAYSLNPPSRLGWLAVFDCRCGLWNGPGSWWSSSGSSPGKPPWGAFAQVPKSPPLDTPRGAAAHASVGVFSACNKVVAGCGSPGVVCRVGVRCAATVWVRGWCRNPCRGLRLAHGQRLRACGVITPELPTVALVVVVGGCCPWGWWWFPAASTRFAWCGLRGVLLVCASRCPPPVGGGAGGRCVPQWETPWGSPQGTTPGCDGDPPRRALWRGENTHTNDHAQAGFA